MYLSLYDFRPLLAPPPHRIPLGLVDILLALFTSSSFALFVVLCLFDFCLVPRPLLRHRLLSPSSFTRRASSPSSAVFRCRCLPPMRVCIVYTQSPIAPTQLKLLDSTRLGPAPPKPKFTARLLPNCKSATRPLAFSPPPRGSTLPITLPLLCMIYATHPYLKCRLLLLGRRLHHRHHHPVVQKESLKESLPTVPLLLPAMLVLLGRCPFLLPIT